MKKIDVKEIIDMQPFTTLGNDGVLLVAGDGEKSNPMTISWGFFGIMWGMPMAIVAVRNTRYTYDFMNKINEFSINWLADDKKDALMICGTKSGRDIDKYIEAGITPVAGMEISTPSVKESKLVLECQTVYTTDLAAEGFIDKSILGMYQADDYHTLYFGKVVSTFSSILSADRKLTCFERVFDFGVF